MKVSVFKVSNLRNDEHFQFHTEFKDLVTKYSAQALKIEDKFNTYLPVFNQEAEAMHVIRKSALTAQLASADVERDQIIDGFQSAVESALNHFDIAKKNAANKLIIVLNTYGKITTMQYDAETAAINKLVKELQTVYASEIATLGLIDWVTELANRNNAFDMLMKSRTAEGASKTDVVMKSTRVCADDAYKSITQYVDSYITVNGESVHEPFVRELNSCIDRFASALAIRAGHNAKSNKPASQPAVAG